MTLSKASILQLSAFLMVQLSHLYMMTTRKTIALTRRPLSEVMSLLFNMLSRFVIVFLPKSKRLLISWLQSPSTVILESKNIKICHCFHFPPSISHEVMGPDAMILVFWMLSFKPALSLYDDSFKPAFSTLWWQMEIKHFTVSILQCLLVSCLKTNLNK